MKKFNKLMALVMAASMMFSLASCGEKKNGEENEIPTLKWYIPGTKQADQETVNARINEILEKEAGCHLNIEYLESGVYSEKMQMAMASQEAYDLCFTGYINPYIDAAQRGGLLNIDEYIKNSDIIKEVIPQYALDAAKINGEIYAIPNLQVMATAKAVYIQKALFEEWGQLKIEDVKCLEDIEPFMEWVVANHPEVYPAQAPLSGGWKEAESFDNVVLTPVSGVNVVERDGTVTAVIAPEDPGTLFGAKKQREYFEKGFYRQDLAVVTDDSADVSSNKYAITMGVHKPGADVELSVERGVDYIAARVTEAELRSQVGRTTMTGIGKNSKYPDKAFKVIELVNSNQELNNLIAFGVEGIHYEKTGENRIELIENSGYQPGSTWRFGTQFENYLLPGQEDGVWEETIEFNNTAKVSPIIDFTFDNTQVRTEIAQLQTINSKYMSFSRGFLPLEDYFDEYMQELKKAGVQKVVDEVNKQLDEYYKNKK